MTNSNSKCGEVTFCTQVGKRVYVLNCIYCSQICLQWEMFINHLEQEHDSKLSLEPIVQPETSKNPVKIEAPEIIIDEPTTTPVHINKKQKMMDESLPSSSAFDDPLESEYSASEMCLETCIKVEEEECSPNLNLFETEENSSENIMADCTINISKTTTDVPSIESIVTCTEHFSQPSKSLTAKHNNNDSQLSVMNKLLSAWGLQHTLKFFEEQNITIEVLFIMPANDISDVTKHMKIGDKILFKYYFEKWRAKQNPLANSQHTHSVPSTVSSFQSSSSEIESDNSKIIVLDILKAHKHGSEILTYYENSKKISEEQRTCIVNIIVQYFEANDIHMSLQSSYALENQILTIFPTEKLEYYRTERRGKIYIKYYNKKKSLKFFKTNSSYLSTKSTDPNDTLGMNKNKKIQK